MRLTKKIEINYGGAHSDCFLVEDVASQKCYIYNTEDNYYYSLLTDREHEGTETLEGIETELYYRSQSNLSGAGTLTYAPSRHRVTRIGHYRPSCGEQKTVMTGKVMIYVPVDHGVVKGEIVVSDGDLVTTTRYVGHLATYIEKGLAGGVGDKERYMTFYLRRPDDVDTFTLPLPKDRSLWRFLKYFYRGQNPDINPHQDDLISSYGEMNEILSHNGRVIVLMPEWRKMGIFGVGHPLGFVDERFDTVHEAIESINGLSLHRVTTSHDTDWFLLRETIRKDRYSGKETYSSQIELLDSHEEWTEKIEGFYPTRYEYEWVDNEESLESAAQKASVKFEADKADRELQKEFADFLETGDVLITRQDSVECGNCPSGTDDFIARNNLDPAGESLETLRASKNWPQIKANQNFLRAARHAWKKSKEITPPKEAS